MTEEEYFKLIFDLQFEPLEVYVNGKKVGYSPFPKELKNLLLDIEEEFIHSLACISPEVPVETVPSTGNFPAPSLAHWVYNAFVNLPEEYQGMRFIDLGTSGLPHVLAAAMSSQRFNAVSGVEYFGDLASTANILLIDSGYYNKKGDFVKVADFTNLPWASYDLSNTLFYYFPTSDTDLETTVRAVNPHYLMVYSPMISNSDIDEDPVDELMIGLGYVRELTFCFSQNCWDNVSQANPHFPLGAKQLISQTDGVLEHCIAVYVKIDE